MGRGGRGLVGGRVLVSWVGVAVLATFLLLAQHNWNLTGSGNGNNVGQAKRGRRDETSEGGGGGGTGGTEQRHWTKSSVLSTPVQLDLNSVHPVC
ncbi:hypothetical protein QBC45DRAFT_421722 [Copromyces sp. CBS 386.78]|nr:hypothetical protein QBC45DRAFT_421722 [Copromyces sp. CBS 386.78]